MAKAIRFGKTLKFMASASGYVAKIMTGIVEIPNENLLRKRMFGRIIFPIRVCPGWKKKMSLSCGEIGS
jgi:hypothetical protein